MDEEALRNQLEAVFDPQPTVLEQVVRQATRLERQFEEDTDTELTVDLLVEKLESADRPLKASWNWWVGALDFIEDDYEQYQI